MSLSYVQQSLIHEERKLSGEFRPSGGTTTGQRTSALVGGQREKRFDQHWKPRCYSCGEEGHFRRDCPKTRGKTTSRSRSKHKAKPAEARFFQPDDMTNSDSESEGAGAFAALSESPDIEGWLIDSCHMTQPKKMLVDYQEFKHPEKVSLGDGRTVKAVGVGNVPMTMRLTKELCDAR